MTAPSPLTALVGPGTARDVACSIGAARAFVGAACLLFPSLARVWVGPAGGSAGAKVLSRSLAARDLVLGYGTASSAPGPDLRKWALLSAASDGVDAIGTVLAYRHMPRARRALIALASVGAAAAGVLAATSLGEGPPGTAG